MQVTREDWTTWEFDPSTTAPSTALLEALAVVEDVDPTRLFEGGDVSIHDFVDTNGLDSLLTGVSGDAISVSLTVMGHPVQISNDGLVMIQHERLE